MKTSNIITLLGVSGLIIYALIQILNFYGISSSIYGIYLIFYIFIIFSIIVLPTDYPKIL